MKLNHRNRLAKQMAKLKTTDFNLVVVLGVDTVKHIFQVDTWSKDEKDIPAVQKIGDQIYEAITKGTLKLSDAPAPSS